MENIKAMAAFSDAIEIDIQLRMIISGFKKQFTEKQMDDIKAIRNIDISVFNENIKIKDIAKFVTSTLNSVSGKLPFFKTTKLGICQIVALFNSQIQLNGKHNIPVARSASCMHKAISIYIKAHADEKLMSNFGMTLSVQHVISTIELSIGADIFFNDDIVHMYRLHRHLTGLLTYISNGGLDASKMHRLISLSDEINKLNDMITLGPPFSTFTFNTGIRQWDNPIINSIIDDLDFAIENRKQLS